jgi:hypothetical protein
MHYTGACYVAQTVPAENAAPTGEAAMHFHQLSSARPVRGASPTGEPS